MAKTSSPHLFQLIRSLSGGEKRYFKMFSQINSAEKENKYLQLFDAIDGQEQYDEKKLIEENKSFAYGEQFPVLKNYLYNQLLRSMENFHSSIHAEIKSLLHRVEFLHEKGLYQQCKTVLLKAKQFAYKHDLYVALLEILRPWERLLALQQNDFPHIKRIVKEYRETIEKVQTIRRYREMEDEMAILYFSFGKKKDSYYLKESGKIMKHPLMKNPEIKKLPFDAQVSFHWTCGLYHQLCGELLKAHESNRSIYTLFLQKPQKQQTHPLLFIRCLNNMVMACNQLKKYEKVPAYLVMLRKVIASIPPQTELAKSSFYRYAAQSMDYYIRTAQLNNAREMVHELSQGIRKYEHKLNNMEKLILWGNLALVYFLLRDEHSCLSWLNRLRNEIRLVERMVFMIFLHTFYILVHYEANHHDLIPSLLKPAKRILKEQKRPYKVTALLLEFFPRLIKANAKEKRELFLSLKQKLFLLKEDKSEEISFEQFDYISWVDSKIQNRPFAEVVREKANQK